jgi:hypothetical protein
MKFKNNITKQHVFDASIYTSPYAGEAVVQEHPRLYKALVLDFELCPGSYATKLLRELTKHSTESLYQAHLTAQHVRSLHVSSSSAGMNAASTDGETVVDVTLASSSAEATPPTCERMAMEDQPNKKSKLD